MAVRMTAESAALLRDYFRELHQWQEEEADDLEALHNELEAAYEADDEIYDPSSDSWFDGHNDRGEPIGDDGWEIDIGGESGAA